MFKPTTSLRVRALERSAPAHQFCKDPERAHPLSLTEQTPSRIRHRLEYFKFYANRERLSSLRKIVYLIARRLIYRRQQQAIAANFRSAQKGAIACSIISDDAHQLAATMLVTPEYTIRNSVLGGKL